MGTWPPQCSARRGLGPRFTPLERLGATGRPPAALSPNEGAPSFAAGPSGVAMGARFCGGAGELGLSAPVHSGHVTYRELAMDFESRNNRALPARPGHHHAWQVLAPRKRARVLREAIDLLQPLLASSTLLEGSFQWVCASVVPLGGFRSIGRTERPVFACCLDMHQHVQQLRPHCVELWMCRLTTPRVGRWPLSSGCRRLIPLPRPGSPGAFGGGPCHKAVVGGPVTWPRIGVLSPYSGGPL